MDELFGESDLTPEEAAMLRQSRMQMLAGFQGFQEPAGGMGADEEHLLASAYQGSIWATLALKALRELLIRKGLVSEAEIAAHTNEVVRREWNEVVEQTAPPRLAAQYVVRDPEEFPRLNLSSREEADEG